MPALYRKLGKNGPEVPALGYGLMGLSQPVYGTVPSEQDRLAVLDRAYELGARFWDTSDLYADSEQTLGKWFQRTGKRSEIFLATKFGFVKGGFPELDSSGEYCKRACAESLKTFGVEFIDLYYLHHANTKTPIEDTMRALKELKEEGKIKYIGLSTISSNTLRRACKIAHVDAVQVEYSPFLLDIEGSKGTNLLETCRELGVAVVAATPLGRGLLTSTFASGTNENAKDMRPAIIPRFHQDNRESNVKLVHKWQEIAQKKGCTAAQLALAWLLKQGEDIFLIPGTKKMKYLEENCAALDVELDDGDVAEVREFAESAEVAGPNLPPAFASFSFTDTVEET